MRSASRSPSLVLRGCAFSLIAVLGCGGGSAERASPANATPAARGATAPAPVFGSVQGAVDGAHRSARNRARDVYRHPVDTLAFFQVRAGLDVVELWPGGGWYTEILAPLLHDEGSLRAVVPTGRFLTSYKKFLAGNPGVYGRVQVVAVDTKKLPLELGPEASADAVLTFRNFHNWMAGGYETAVVEAAFRVLRPGGVFGVVEHRADDDATRETMARSGYVSVGTIVDAATAAGFVLEEASETNANPKDTHDHPSGVWTLPPSLRLGEQDRDAYLAIGESDRMTLRFRKPTPGGEADGERP